MPYISDTDWARAIKAEPRMAEARTELEEAIRSDVEYNKVKTDGVVPETRNERRRALRRVKSNRQRVTYELTRLGSVTALGDIDQAFGIEEERLSKRRPKNWRRNQLRWRYGSLIREVLEIWSFHLKIDVPTQAAETVNSGRYHRFLEIIIEVVEPRARKSEIEEMMKAGLDFAVKANQARRKDPIYCWQWQDLFPQTYESLFLSSKYRAE
jgi:hypothetical protein